MEIESISDTALWVAVCRAIESARPDALFSDPHAARLAGDRGLRIIDAMPGARKFALDVAVRTAAFDEIVVRTVRDRAVDVVLDLAAGADTRAWRLDLPRELQWIDVDLPRVTEHKRRWMQGERPRCRHRTVSVDLRDTSARRALLSTVAAESARALVLTEGLLIYLADREVLSLACDLHAHASFRWWAIDLVSPWMLWAMRLVWGRKMKSARAPFQFAPKNGTGFFAHHGWVEAEHHAGPELAHRLHRATWMNRALWLLGRALPVPNSAVHRASEIALLRRDSIS